MTQIDGSSIVVDFRTVTEKGCDFVKGQGRLTLSRTVNNGRMASVILFDIT